MDRFKELDLGTVVDMQKASMRQDNRDFKERGHGGPRFTEEEIGIVGPILYEVTQKLGIALVHRKELSKAVLAKQALQAFLEDPQDDYEREVRK